MATQTKKIRYGGQVKINLTASQKRALKKLGADVHSLTLKFPKTKLRTKSVSCDMVRSPKASTRRA